MVKSLCNVKGCVNEGRYCRLHPGGALSVASKPKKESKKRAVINRKVYGPKAKEFVKDHPLCGINSPVCKKDSQCVHHLRGRASEEDLLNEKYWMAACVPCNNWVEQNDAWARANGFKLSKFSKS